MKSIILGAVILFFTFNQLANAQDVTGQILDASSKEPVPFATIIYASQRGVLSNEEGKFNIQANLEPSAIIKIASLGYEPKEMEVSKVNGQIVYLKSQSIQLSDVFLSNKKLSGGRS
tara:strand:+ start:23456 stop:23806 length:351 start_codon:yes stop_codon:yes gene_type:complete